YTLANGQNITTSGTYTFTYKSVSGCDSIVYYNISFNQIPVVKLGADTCFGTRDSLVLKVNAGYDNYIWNGINTANPVYVAKDAGTYMVSAGNYCGSKSDTVMIFNKCEYEIIMPNAFTPNSDGINDLFRIPSQSANRLIHFTIYNRWGQVVFETSDISKGWDGNFKGLQSPFGTYVYNIVMESLDRRNKVSKKGWVILLR
ncbi:MAG TPA: gliding motility-associated C-terminal domain-containing protein, partial [Panacibacter sp.]|nr:gliding motility-associated C-terminal domain-containing protein [Panacibacter sp.]